MAAIDEHSSELNLLLQRYKGRLQENSRYKEIEDKLDKALDSSPVLATGTLLERHEVFALKLDHVILASDYVAEAIILNPDLLLEIVKADNNEDTYDPQSELDQLLLDLENSNSKSSLTELKRRLRIFHRQQFVRILWQDLTGFLPVKQVCQQMSQLADACVKSSLNLLYHWCCKEWGQPMANSAVQQLVVLGMGKLGALELNVSSDIDLIFAYPEAGETRPKGEEVTDFQAMSNQQFFVKLGQRLIDALNSVTADGFVFRVDMRLRPYGSEGALVLGFDAMENYYQNQGRDWERYALIKARVIAGDFVQGNELLKQLKPFVYRRYLDFAMFESLREMKGQINKQARRKNLDNDIKLGVGGIREIEFIVQAIQLVHGGKDRNLRQPSIYKVSEHLKNAEYLPAEVIDELMNCYNFLRKLEHRLQALGNEQTQLLPTDKVKQQRIAHAMGCASWTELDAWQQQIRESVANHFKEIIKSEADSEKQERARETQWELVWKKQLDDEVASRYMQKKGFKDPLDSLQILRKFQQDRKTVTLPQDSQQRLEAFMPMLLHEISESAAPDMCLQRVMGLVEAVSRRTAYLVLLMENPPALGRLVLYFSQSPFIADFLIKYPVLLDELLDVLDNPPEKTKLRDELQLQLLRIAENNFEEQLECLHYFKQSHILQVAAAEVSGKMPLMKVSDYLTFTAEVILEQVLAICWENLSARHGFPVHTDGNFGSPDFAIIAYGKMGGIELGYKSDLDLVFIHQAALDKDTVVVTSQRSINSREFYIRLAQKIISMLSTYTISGCIYDIDMRLRPSGESGLLVSSIESFRNYQFEKAWTWEHQALVRARGVVGNAELIGKFTQLRHEVLSQQRDHETLVGEILTMRKRMRDELGKKTKSDEKKLAFELKQGEGGIVDIEFLVQFIVLSNGYECPELLTYTDNFRILEAARHCKLISPKDVDKLINAYLELRSASHQLALEQPGTIASVEKLLTHQLAVAKIWDSVFAGFEKPPENNLSQ